MYKNICNYKCIDIRYSSREYLENLGIEIAEQRTGFGYRNFCVCSECGSRRVRLYRDNYDCEYICRECLKLSYPRQQIYDEDLDNVITRKMVSILYKLKVPRRKIQSVLTSIDTFETASSADGSHIALFIERPKGMHYKTYYKYLKRLHRLDIARTDFILFRNKELWYIYKTFVRDGIW